MEFIDYIPEIVVGIILLGFAHSFRGWSKVVEESSGKIIRRLESLSKEVHDHMVRTENRVTRVETKVETIESRLDRCEIKKDPKETNG